MNLESTPLLTDLYQLTMLKGYFDQGMNETAVFEFFVRKLPPGRNFLVAAGLAQVVDFLLDFRFGEEETSWLAESGRFDREFIDYLGGLRFTGDLHAMPEGTPFFANEPILRVTAPLPQAQLLESRLINILHCQTLFASKAARSVLVAPGKLLVDFGMRRAHGAEASLFAARASYLVGFAGSSTVLAGARYNIPLYGTMAHSFVQAHDRESAAFINFARAQPGQVVLLIDTYDTERAAAKVVRLAPQLKAAGIAIRAVRLDSGDLADHARKVRVILDDGGLQEVAIFASGNLDEYQIAAYLAEGAPIDGFGVGTRLDTAADAPYLDCAYKLIEYAKLPRRKHSEGKRLLPGRKQVWRRYEDGEMTGDTITVEGDRWSGRPLVEPVMRRGRLVDKLPSLDASREYAGNQLATLPEPLRALEDVPAYPVQIAPALERLAMDVDRFLAEDQAADG